MFQVSKEERNSLRSQIVPSKVPDNKIDTNLMSQIAISNWSGARKRPYTFTRNGIGMLSSVLRSETAAATKMKVSPEVVLQLLK